MAKVFFFLRNNSKNTEVTIWARVSAGKKTADGKKTLFFVSTSQQINSSDWSKKTGQLKDGVIGEEKAKRYKIVNENLNDIRELLLKRVSGEMEYTPQQAKGDITNLLQSKINAKDSAPVDVMEYLSWLISEMKSQKRRFRGEAYDTDTIKAWSTFSEQAFRPFYKKHPFEWDSVSGKTYDLFVKFLKDSKGYSVKTINKYIIDFKCLVRYAAADKLHNNTNVLDKFYRLKVNEGDTKKKIYLTTEELNALYKMPLALGSIQDKVRDVFLCGCYTAQRISDYSKLSESNFTYTERGVRVVKLVQEKTKNFVVIPITNDHLEDIAKKYNYNLPYLPSQYLNREIKVILEELSESVPSLARYETTILTKEEKRLERADKAGFERNDKGEVIKPRYELVSSHTARRSCITNLYLTREFTNAQIMSISGHKTEKTFLEYVCLSSETLAEEITEILNRKSNNISSNEDMF